MTVTQKRGYTRAGVAVLSVLLTAVPGTLAANEPQVARNFAIPMTLLEEHAEFHTSLQTATRVAAGPVRQAAEDVLALLKPHFAKEQGYALAPLKLLPALARDQVTADMAEWLATSDRLRAELDTLLHEHRAIATALNQLAQTAWAEGQPEYAFLAARILRHARLEEEVLYPAGLLVGDYLRMRLEPRTTANAPIVAPSGAAMN